MGFFCSMRGFWMGNGKNVSTFIVQCYILLQNIWSKTQFHTNSGTGAMWTATSQWQDAGGGCWDDCWPRMESYASGCFRCCLHHLVTLATRYLLPRRTSSEIINSSLWRSQSTKWLNINKDYHVYKYKERLPQRLTTDVKPPESFLRPTSERRRTIKLIYWPVNPINCLLYRSCWVIYTEYWGIYIHFTVSNLQFSGPRLQRVNWNLLYRNEKREVVKCIVQRL